MDKKIVCNVMVGTEYFTLNPLTELDEEVVRKAANLINDKMHEDSVNIKQVKALKANGVVTVNEVLRTSLQLSNHKMSWTELDNDVQIAEHKLKTILSLPENQEMHVDTEDLISENAEIPYVNELTETALHKNESVEMASKNLSLKELDKKITKANYLPKITAGGEYFFKKIHLVWVLDLVVLDVIPKPKNFNRSFKYH